MDNTVTLFTILCVLVFGELLVAPALEVQLDKATTIRSLSHLHLFCLSQPRPRFYVILTLTSTQARLRNSPSLALDSLYLFLPSLFVRLYINHMRDRDDNVTSWIHS